MSFTHLHVHTGYSVLDGAGRIKDLVKKAKELNQEALSITDHGVMYGTMEFFGECLRNGIKPIIGCEIYMIEGDMLDRGEKEERYHLILLCKNKLGYQNLVKIVSKSFVDGFYYKPRVDYETLEKYSEGLVCLSACLQGEVAVNLLRENYNAAKNVALRLQNIFGKEDFYIEIQNHNLQQELFIHTDLIRLSKDIGSKIVATNDVHYTLKEDEEAHDCLLCLQTGKKVSDTDRMKYEGGQYFLKSEAEMRESFSFIEEAIDNTEEVKNKCNVQLEFTKTSYDKFISDIEKGIKSGKISEDKKFLFDMVEKCDYHVPKYEVEEGFTNITYLKKLVSDGAKKRFGEPSKEILDRLDYELGIIINMGFVDYFLLVWDYIHYAKTHDIPVGPGRGSGVGSLVAYVLEITNTNPLDYNLYFERFLNPERVSMPDIDTDFDDNKRPEVIEYVKQKYGIENVAQIVTFGRMGVKGSIRDIGRVLDVPLDKCNKTAKLIPEGILPNDKALGKKDGKFNGDFDKILNGDVMGFRPQDQSNIVDFRNLYETDSDIKHIVDIAIRLEDVPRSIGVHASGVLIAPDKIQNFLPIARSKDESLVTQYNMVELEELGMLKMDFLGLRNLSAIENCVKNIKEKYDSNFDIDKIPYDDKNVYEMIASGDTLGIFQIESKGMTNFMKNLGPTCIDDLIAGISLFRPGPMDSIPKYIDSKKNIENVKYDTPKLQKILENTYGCIVYQEHVMEIFRELAGFSLGRADEVRRAMSKKKMEKLMAEEKNFIYGNEDLKIDGCLKRGVDEKIAKKIFDDMSSFAEYAFNKSHAAAYAKLAYQTAYLKYYYRVEFYSCICDSVLSNRKLLSYYVSRIQMEGIKILPCDVNLSNVNFKVEDNNIRLGFASIKGVSSKFSSFIVEEREKNGPYQSMTSCIKRLNDIEDKKVANKTLLENLVWVGAFDGFIGNRNQKIFMLPKIMQDIQNENISKKKLLPGEKGIFDFLDENDETNENIVDDELYIKDYLDEKDFDEEGKLLKEKEMTGIYISGHPLNSYKDYIDDNTNHIISDFFPVDDYDEEYLSYDGDKVLVVGIIDEVKKMMTKRGEYYARCVLSDQSDSINCVVFPKTFKNAENLLYVNNIVLIEGKIQYELEKNSTTILVEKVSNIDRNYDKSEKNKTLYIIFENIDSYKNNILDLKNVFEKYNGNMKVLVIIKDIKQMKFLPNVKVRNSEELIQDLKQKMGDNNVYVKEDKTSDEKVNTQL